MRYLVAAAFCAAIFAGGAMAAPTPVHRPPPKLFLSPSGQPFRLGPGDPDPLKAWFDQVDVSHKGYIDRADFRADAARFFKKLDENGDGVIDGFEEADYESKVVPELGEWADGEFPGEFGPAGGKRGRAKGGHGRGQAPRGIAQLLDEPEPVTGADFNMDSRITFAEWMQATDQRFDLLDTGRTGRLTLDQLRARLAAQPARMR